MTTKWQRSYLLVAVGCMTSTPLAAAQFGDVVCGTGDFDGVAHGLASFAAAGCDCSRACSLVAFGWVLLTYSREEPMELALQEDGSVTVVTLSGDLVVGEAEATFKRTVSRLLEEGRVQLVVDCSGLRYVDSSGLGSLVRALTTSQHEGGSTKLLGVPTTLHKLLELTKLDSVFESFDNRDQAVSSF